MTEHDEDPDRLIYPWTTHITVPKWVDKNAYPNCKHCKSLLKTGHKHNCRLCGEMFCSACTGKYHLPSVFELKGKKGASRVCMSCKDSCLEQKKKEKEEEAAKQTGAKAKSAQLKKTVLKSFSDESSSSSSSSSSDGMDVKDASSIEIAPPEWEPIESFNECAKCHKKGGGKPHNCRACGKLFCSKCTSKMMVPSFFEKKGKEGPSRVCDGCRFLIISGAQLVEKKTDVVARDRQDSGRKRWGSTSSARSCLVSGCANPRVTKKGYCANHANAEDLTDLSSDVSLSFRFEGDLSVITKIAASEPTMTLTEIDRVFKRQAGGQIQKPFNYIYNNEVIPLAFYDVFTAAVFGGSLTLREKLTVSSSYDDSSSSSSMPVSELPSRVEDVPRVNNPFKRSEVDAFKEEQKKKVEEEEAKKQITFKKPELKKMPLPAFAAPSSAPPSAPSSSSSSAPPPSSSNASSSSNDGGDPFKNRAKNVFGAK